MGDPFFTEYSVKKPVPVVDEQKELERFRQHKLKTLGSLLHFTKVFYAIRTGRQFTVSMPPGRESHFISISRAFTNIIEGRTTRLIINVPPRYAKTELAIHFIAWSLAQYPDSNFLYISYTHSLARRQTQTIREIVRLREYQNLYGVSLKDDSAAKDNFETGHGGSVFAVGTGGSITGRGAGVKNAGRFGGAIVCDDLLRPDEATSDTIREGINEWYFNTLQSRVNDPSTPIIVIGQRVHENDICAHLMATGDYELLSLPARDVVGNPLYPEMHDKFALQKLEEQSPYVFASQYQQDPSPAGGGIFRPEWFVLKEQEPKILATFITADTAETDKSYNDATVFSLWGIYCIENFGEEMDLYALHWLDCMEARMEPSELEDAFMDFYRVAMRHRVKPSIAAIEKKSTGVTLVSALKRYQGLRVMEIERTRKSGSKVQRFLETQPYVARGQVSLPSEGRHTAVCIEHMRKITANGTHRFDDICDTLSDAVHIALIDNAIPLATKMDSEKEGAIRDVYATKRRADAARRKAYKQ